VAGGPMMVVHDEEDFGIRGTNGGTRGVGVGGGGNSANTPSPVRKGMRTGGLGGSNNNANASSATELRGQSEYIRISEQDREVLRGDQLDKLLFQARNARN
jgi:hypothetical protein